MADTLIERITGTPADAPTPIAVNLVLTDHTLLTDDTTPAHLDGYGPIPAAIAHQFLTSAIADKHCWASLRRLYAHPQTGALVALESRARHFPAGLARFLTLRDQTCRTPYCDAPIRHNDHAQPAHCGGRTSATNGLGLCERCNYVKENPGWRVTTHTDGGRHTAEYVTPTGAKHRSKSPPLPSHPPDRPRIDLSEIEAGIAVALINRHAA